MGNPNQDQIIEAILKELAEVKKVNETLLKQHNSAVTAQGFLGITVFAATLYVAISIGPEAGVGVLILLAIWLFNLVVSA